MSNATPDYHLEDLDAYTGDEKILKEAEKRFHMCQKWESTARQRYVDDYKFCNADSENGYQWPEHLKFVRGSDRPSLTINKTLQHCNQITNDAKQNKPSVKIRPIGDGASFDAAQVFDGIVRHVEYISNAATVYDEATRFMVQGGFGYWRVKTRYEHDLTHNQELVIEGIPDPLSVFLDPSAKERDKSDARFGFVFEDYTRDEFRELVGKAKADKLWGNKVFGNNSLATGQFLDANNIRIAEYFRVVIVKDQLHTITHSDGSVTNQLEGDMEDGHVKIVKALKEQDEHAVKSREVEKRRVEWYKIAGDKIIDRMTETVFDIIPIVPVVGMEVIIDGILDRKSHTRLLKDPQKMYNYWTSAAVEFVALQTKSPYVGPAEAISGHEMYWAEANRKNFAYLPYNPFDKMGRPLDRPERQQGPQMAQGFLEGMKISQEEMMMATGQYQAQMGQNENAKSGKAIAERQRQGDNSTYHWIDAVAIAVRKTGKILIKAIPRIYDTDRIIKILAEDGNEHEVHVDPNAKQAYQAQPAKPGDNVRAIFNPSVGRYDVQSDVGPSFSTKRQEAFNAFEQLMSQNPELLHVVGDLMFLSADFPLADKIAERIKRTIPSNVLGEGPDPQTQKQLQDLQSQNAILQKSLAESLNKAAHMALKLAGKDQKRDIEVYRADTERLKVELGAEQAVSPEEIAALVHQTIQEMTNDGLTPIDQANVAGIQAQSGSPDPALGGQGSPAGPGGPQGGPNPQRVPGAGGRNTPAALGNAGPGGAVRALVGQRQNLQGSIEKLAQLIGQSHQHLSHQLAEHTRIAAAPRIVHRHPQTGKVMAVEPVLGDGPPGTAGNPPKPPQL